MVIGGGNGAGGASAETTALIGTMLDSMLSDSKQVQQVNR
jgi:hypothetical protein